MISHAIINDTALVITDATNAIPIVLTMSAAHGLTASMLVTVEGVIGNTAANVVDAAITVPSTTTIGLTDVAGNGAYLSPPSGRVLTAGFGDRTYAAVTAQTGSVYTFPDKKVSDTFILWAQAPTDPTSVGDEVDVTVYGRVHPSAGWNPLTTLDENDAWATGSGGNFISVKTGLQIYPELRMDVVASGGSSNNVQAWILI